MSVGGRVIEALRVSDSEVWVNTCDVPSRLGIPHVHVESKKCNECAVRVRTDERIREGDALWWQGNTCYWTPRSDPDDDRIEVKLKRAGYSHTATDKVKRRVRQEAQDYRASKVLDTLAY